MEKKNYKNICIAINAYNKAQCRKPPLNDSLYCIYHDPSEKWVNWRKENGAKGGKWERGIRFKIPDFQIRDERDIVKLTSKMLEAVGSGKYIVNLKDYPTISKLTDSYLKAKQKSDEAYRLEQLEKTVGVDKKK